MYVLYTYNEGTPVTLSPLVAFQNTLTLNKNYINNIIHKKKEKNNIII